MEPSSRQEQQATHYPPTPRLLQSASHHLLSLLQQVSTLPNEHYTLKPLPHIQLKNVNPLLFKAFLTPSVETLLFSFYFLSILNMRLSILYSGHN